MSKGLFRFKKKEIKIWVLKRNRKQKFNKKKTKKVNFTNILQVTNKIIRALEKMIKAALAAKKMRTINQISY